MDNFVQIKRNNIVKIGLQTEDGKDTGNYWEFDVEDIEWKLRCNELIEQNKKNMQYFENEIKLIEKREDHKGKKALSKNEEDIAKAWNKFYHEQIKVYNMFLGENGVEKYLNGRKPYITMFLDINEAIESILPIIEEKSKAIPDIIKQKYGKKADDVIE